MLLALSNTVKHRCVRVKGTFVDILSYPRCNTTEKWWIKMQYAGIKFLLWTNGKFDRTLFVCMLWHSRLFMIIWKNWVFFDFFWAVYIYNESTLHCLVHLIMCTSPNSIGHSFKPTENTQITMYATNNYNKEIYTC